MKRIVLLLIAAVAAIGLAARGHAAGVLTPKGSPHAPIQLRDHQVDIVINNGFARTEVQQTFYNPGTTNLDALFSLPLPKSASLSEVTIFTGEKEIHGEVLPKAEAQKTFEDERSKGNDTGKAEKNGIQSFEFTVSPVRPQSETRIRFVYYQPLEIDTGIGRFVYPLEDGGTDDVGRSFWERNEKVEGNISIQLELKSAWPVADVRVPGFETAAQTQKVGDGHYKVALQRQGESLNRDFVFYYRLEDNLPGRVEVIPYRADRDKPGTFMMVVTPGLDLQPITHGADYCFVLDVSGSMQGKLATLAKGVGKSLQSLKPADRFRIVTFSNNAKDLTTGFQNATPENVRAAVERVGTLRTEGGTDLYSGIHLGLKELDADRATSIVLVTDGVANQGIIAPQEFHKLLKQYDVRVFGFLMGNSANWPLMRTICAATGGFYAGVSNDDDIIGQLMLAKSKITHECLHDAALKVSGVKILDDTDDFIGKVYRGQQLVIFGRYDKPGSAVVTLKARLTGEDKTYTASFNFPEIDTDNPEVERLYALNRIEMLEDQENAGLLPATEAKDAIESLGVKYQLVTDHTSMVMLSDESFAQRGIERRNKARVTEERRAQTVRAGQPIKNYRVDESAPMFKHTAPTLAPSGGGSGGGGGGGGALDPFAVLMLLGAGGLAAAACRKDSSPS
jgi:Ca-activated chloride channel family protein